MGVLDFTLDNGFATKEGSWLGVVQGDEQAVVALHVINRTRRTAATPPQGLCARGKSPNNK